MLILRDDPRVSASCNQYRARLLALALLDLYPAHGGVFIDLSCPEIPEDRGLQRQFEGTGDTTSRASRQADVEHKVFVVLQAPDRSSVFQHVLLYILLEYGIQFRDLLIT